MASAPLTEHVSHSEEESEYTPMAETGERKPKYFYPIRVHKYTKWAPWILSGVLLIIIIILIIWATVIKSDGSDDCNSSQPLPQYSTHPDSNQPVNASIAAVASDHPVCSQMGTTVLKKGGNAADATVTTVLCLGVLNPFASGVGGGAVIVVRTPDGQTKVIDSREVAPAAASTNMYQNLSSDASIYGGLAVAVPGELRGLERLFNLYRGGIVSWSQLVLPVAQLAKNFTVGTQLAKKIKDNKDRILNEPSMRAVFAPNGVPLVEGDFCYWTKLGETLEAVAQYGVDAFYTGKIGEALSQDIITNGGIITPDDLKNYKVVEREVLTTWYHGYKVLSAPPPFGGVLVEMVLNILEGFNFKSLGWTSTDFPQYMVEAFKFAYDDRMALGDPNYVDTVSSIVATMLDKDHAAKLRQKISRTQSHELQYYEDLYPLTDQAHNQGTSHLSIVDGQRMAVSCTTTINLTFGAYFISNQTGVLLNDEMDDFSIPGRPSAYNVPPSPANYIEPGKRPLSSMSPTIILKNDKLHMIVGASGGTRIPTATIQASINVLDFGMNPYDAVAAARIHDQLIPYLVYYEADYPKDKLDFLVATDQFLEKTSTVANTQCVVVSDDDTNPGCK